MPDITKIPGSDSETEVINKILLGELSLFEILIRRYNASLYKTGRSYRFSHEDTQDLMQDTFLDAFKNLAGFEHRSSFKTWIIKIMLNNCYKKQLKFSYQFEHSKPIEENATPLFSNFQSPDAISSVMNKELNTIIEQAITKLPPEYTMVFTMRELNGLNTEETADALQISIPNVKVRLNRAKRMLRKEIEKVYSPGEIFEFNLQYCDGMVVRVMEKIIQLPH